MDPDDRPSSPSKTRSSTGDLPSGDYEYLTEGYYACQDAELNASRTLPSTADTLDAYVVPIALERVRLAGLPVPEWYLTNRDFETPAVLYGVNPFARNHVVVRPDDDAAAAARMVSRRGKFAICCQRLPPGAVLIEFDQVYDRASDERFAHWAEALHRLFHLPLARVRLIATAGREYFSAVERLPRERLSEPAARLLQAIQQPDHHRE